MLITVEYQKSQVYYNYSSACSRTFRIKLSTVVVFILTFTGAIRCIDVSSDGCTVVTGGEDGQVIMWKLHV